MKKKKYWIIGGVVALGLICFIVLIILLSNQGTTTLKCVKTEKETLLDSVSTITVRFKNNKMSFVETKNEAVAKSDALKENIDVAYNTIQSQFGDYKNEKGVIIKTSKLSDRITFTITVDANQNPEMVEIVGSSLSSEMTYDDVKKELENRKFTCE